MAIILDGSAGLTLPVDLAETEGGTGVSASNIIVQSVRTDDGAYATGTGTIPPDDTIPQNTEGTEFMTLAITPKNASNILNIEVILKGSLSAATYMIGALFQDANADALSTTAIDSTNANYYTFISISHRMVAGTTSTTTFKVRAGADTAATTYFNGTSVGRKFGGSLVSSITITEVTP